MLLRSFQTKITVKQADLFKAYFSGKYRVLALGGGVGSSKTIGILLLFNYLCTRIPNLRMGVFRKSEKNHKQNTIPSFRKVLRYSKTQGVDIKNMEAHYPNGSSIVFLWADISKDPDCDNVRGGEFTLIFFNEASQISKKYYDEAKTRVGRWNEIECKDGNLRIKPAIFLDFNPNYTWCRDEFYDPYIDKTLPSHIYFQLSLPIDNIFLTKDYFKSLDDLPPEEYKRYVKGNWNYGDDPNQLIKYEWYKNCKMDTQYKYSHRENIILSIDPAREGDDRTIFAYMFDNNIGKYEEFKKQDPSVSGLIALERMKEYKIDQQDIVIDSIGVGGGAVDEMKLNKVNPFEFKGSNAASQRKGFLGLKNRRTEAYWFLREALRKQEISILHDQSLQKELLAITYKTTDKEIKIYAKDEIKKILGYSPDYADAVSMAVWRYFMKSPIIIKSSFDDGYKRDPILETIVGAMEY